MRGTQWMAQSVPVQIDVTDWLLFLHTNSETIVVGVEPALDCQILAWLNSSLHPNSEGLFPGTGTGPHDTNRVCDEGEHVYTLHPWAKV